MENKSCSFSGGYVLKANVGYYDSSLSVYACLLQRSDVFKHNSSATSLEASPLPPLELEPCSPQTAPLSPPRRAFPPTDSGVSWPPAPVWLPLPPTLLPPAEEGDPPPAPRLRVRSDEAEVVQRLGSAGGGGPWQRAGAGRTRLLSWLGGMEGWRWLRQTGEKTPRRPTGATGGAARLELKTGTSKPVQRRQPSEAWPSRRRTWRRSLAEAAFGAEPV